MTAVKKKLKSRSGAVSIVAVGLTLAIILFAMFFLELQEMFDYQYAIEVRAQRAVNSTVEYAMDDTYRADGWNFMDVPTAQACWQTYMDEALNVDAHGRCLDSTGRVLYTVHYSDPVFWPGGKDRTAASYHDAGMEIAITVNMSAGLGKFFGRDGYTWTQTFSSTNFRTDDDERWGAYT